MRQRIEIVARYISADDSLIPRILRHHRKGFFLRHDKSNSLDLNSVGMKGFICNQLQRLGRLSASLKTRIHKTNGLLIKPERRLGDSLLDGELDYVNAGISRPRHLGTRPRNVVARQQHWPEYDRTTLT